MPANKDTKITLYWYVAPISPPPLTYSIYFASPSKLNFTNISTRLEKSRAQRILWLLEELDLSYDIVTFKRQPDLLAPPELKKIHPLGKSPVITLERPGKKKITLAESAVIIEYLCEHFGGDKLIPKKFENEEEAKEAKGGEDEIGEESEGWMRYRYLMHYAEGSLMPFLVMQLVMDRMHLPLSLLYPSVCFHALTVVYRSERPPRNPVLRKILASNRSIASRESVPNTEHLRALRFPREYA